MIDRVVGNKLIPANVRQDIIERTDGIPLFVEEMTKAVLEAGSEEEAQRTAATVPTTALAVPASLGPNEGPIIGRWGISRRSRDRPAQCRPCARCRRPLRARRGPDHLRG